MSQFVTLGRFGKTHGIHGWVKVRSATDPANKILDFLPWHIKLHHQWQPVVIDDIQALHDHFIVHIQDIDTPEAAQLYVNKEIGTERDRLPPPAEGEYYWSDLEGLTVINQNNVELGKIDYLFTTHSNDVMVIMGEKRHLIPFIQDQFVKKIDLKNGTMIVDWDPDF